MIGLWLALGTFAGAVGGIAIGAVCEWLHDRRGARR